ncbi:MAG: InlB B-repeat-containing protein [Candidatus Wallbacteria bacterium]|nr:InlB B-repeat-containing protein [Candidatus Wallbacteria bacterium]
MNKNSSALHLRISMLVVLVATVACWAHIGYQVTVDPAQDPNPSLMTLNITVDPAGSGTVAKNPDKAKYKKNEIVVVTATPANGYAFDRWDGSVNSAASQISIKMDTHKSLLAVFKTTGPGATFSLTVNIDPTGSGTVKREPDKTNYSKDETVKLTPLPGSGFVFDGWGGDLSGSASPASIKMTADKTVTARFKAQTVKYKLTVNVTPAGSGTVDKDPGGTEYDKDTTVALTPNPGAGYTFDGWEGDLSGSANPGNIKMTADKTVTARFKASATDKFKLTVNITPAGTGTVIKDPDSAEYEKNTEVKLTADPKDGYVFDAWSGDMSGTVSEQSIVMNSDKTVTASFKEAGPPEKMKFRIAACGNYGGSDNLSNSDADLMSEMLQSNGHILESDVRDAAITKETFFPATPIGILYFTGKGRSDELILVGSVFKRTDYTSDNVMHLILSSSYTVTSDWISAGGTRQKTILGCKGAKTDWSSPSPVRGDYGVVQNFCPLIKDKDPDDAVYYKESWKTSNVRSDFMSDKWSAVCEGQYYTPASKLVISAVTPGRSGGYQSLHELRRKTADGSLHWHEDSRIYNGSCLISGPSCMVIPINDKVGYSFHVQQSGMNPGLLPRLYAGPDPSRVGGLKGRNESGFDFATSPAGGISLWRLTGKNSTSKSIRTGFERAYAFIEQYGGLPPDAVPKCVIPNVVVSPDGSEMVTDYLFEFTRMHGGLEIRGHSGDAIAINVCDDGVVFFKKFWRALSDPDWSDPWQILNPLVALKAATPELSIPEDENIVFAGYSLGYYSPSGEESSWMELQPAYHFIMENGDEIHVNAVTGSLIRPGL